MSAINKKARSNQPARAEQWNNIKQEVFRLYKTQGKTLTETMVDIEAMYGHRSSYAKTATSMWIKLI